MADMNRILFGAEGLAVFFFAIRTFFPLLWEDARKVSEDCADLTHLTCCFGKLTRAPKH
jgi:hypothetical protein